MLTRRGDLRGFFHECGDGVLELGPLALDRTFCVTEHIEDVVGAVMLAGDQEVQHLAFAGGYRWVSGFDLRKYSADCAELLTMAFIFVCNREQLLGGDDFRVQLFGENLIVGARLGDDFLVRLGVVEGAKPTGESQATAQAVFIEIRQRIGERHIKLGNDIQFPLEPGAMPQQEAGQGHGQAEQEHRQAENLFGNTETTEH